MDNSILAIYNKDRSVLGTGFVIDSDNDGIFIATCGHVVTNCGDNILVEGTTPTIIQNKYKEGIDLAILYVEGIQLPPLAIQASKITKEAKVIGYTRLLGDPIKESIQGILVKTKIEIKKSDFLTIDTLALSTPEPISNGYSGSPVICNHSNKVVGIVCIQKDKTKNYAICSKHLLDIYSIPNEVKQEVIIPISYGKVELTSVLSDEEHLFIKHSLSENLTASLSSFIADSNIWVEPQLYNIPEDTPKKKF
ncbi:S1 family peptidase [Paraglaciecola arctica]|uniref:Serine protease n=1 Tax=Paraglaciecola arctica BSs20135 TaxID=493475 RepID=K6YS31_9ALTE|nr:serine protease [Paraglaciecola arctica]GAC20967.1 hypothetical protein GARC_4020 [Paraglaciecola arctica BSs20135]